MKVIAFDLSTKCIGVVAAEVQENNVIKIASCPIMPPSFSPSVLGYCKTKKEIISKKGKRYKSYVKTNEIPPYSNISFAEKQRRDREVRGQKDITILEYIGKRLSEIILTIKPDLIIVEKNCIFNGILTTVLLAKVMGVLIGIAGSVNIPLEEYAVNEVRSLFDMGKLSKEFTKTRSSDVLAKIPDIGKAVLREIMEDKYHIKFLSDDESDACVVFNYWYEKIKKEKKYEFTNGNP